MPPRKVDEPQADEPQADEPQADEPQADDGTVWIGGFHVEVSSAAYVELTSRGLQPGPPPK